MLMMWLPSVSKKSLRQLRTIKRNAAHEIFLVGDWFMLVTNVDGDENHNVKIYGPYETDKQACT